jgi:hypothetical protein
MLNNRQPLMASRRSPLVKDDWVNAPMDDMQELNADSIASSANCRNVSRVLQFLKHDPQAKLPFPCYLSHLQKPVFRHRHSHHLRAFKVCFPARITFDKNTRLWVQELNGSVIVGEKRDIVERNSLQVKVGSVIGQLGDFDFALLHHLLGSLDQIFP